jgi:hypothetical protein
MPPFVGRERELAAIGAGLDEALSGQGRLILLAGEPGAGKTRLGDEVARLAHERGLPVCWGRCWEAGGAPAYWPWLEVLAAMARGLDDAALDQALGEGASLLAQIVPELQGRVTERAAAPPVAEEARFRTWRAARGLIARAAAPAGLVVILDDLHAADESSLALLHFVARERRSLRLLLVGSYRDVEARLTPAVGDLLVRIAREGAVLPVSRFDRATATTFLRQRAGELEPAIEERILESAQGNPLFLGEMARLVTEEGPAAIAAGALPHGVRDVIRQRLERVPAEARPLLDLAAVAGDIDRPLLAEASGISPDQLAALLASAARAGLLAGGERLRFSHALVREVLYRELEPEPRRRLHERVGEALERLRGQAPNPPLAELAHHALEGPAAGLERAVDFSVRAARQALTLHAPEEARSLLQRTLGAVEAAGNPAALRARALLALAEAHIRSGEGSTGRALCLEAASLARRLRDAALLAEATLVYGRVFTMAIVDPLLVGLIEESLGALPTEDSSLRVRLLARLAAALQPARDMREPVRVAEEAIASARRLGDPATLLGAIIAGMSAMMDIVDARERLPLNLEAEQLAVRLGESEALLRTQARLAIDQLELGDLPGADARIAAFESLAADLRAPWWAWRGPMLRAMRAAQQGRFAEAERLGDEGLAAGRAAGEPDAERICLLAREGLLRAWERHADMVAFEPTARRLRSSLHWGDAWQAAASALVAARLEDESSARRYLAMAPPELSPPAANPYAIFFFAEPAALVGPDDLAARLHALLEPAAGRAVVMGLSAFSWEGPVDRLLALLEIRLGRWDQALAHFGSALSELERLDAGPYLARTRYELARALLQRGRAEDRSRAQELLVAARTGAESLGQQGLVVLADRRLAALEIGPDAVDPTSAPFTIAPEGESWLLGFEGQSFRLKDSLGLRYLAHLAAQPDREVHVLELARGREGADDAVDGGDAGELLDEAARDSYRQRLEDLREGLAEAESFGDQARAARTREEIEFLGAELGRAVGLGGRPRRAGVAAERARSAVQRRLRNALDRIAEHSPALKAHLDRTLRTGNFCVYRPAAR